MKSEPSTETFARFFAAAADVYRLAPWTSGHESQVLGLDVPELGCEGACVSIEGDDSGSPGIYVYASIDAYRTFMLDMADALEGQQEPVPAPVLAVLFENTSEQPKEDVRRARKEGWVLASDAAFPEVIFYDEDGPGLPGEAEYVFLTATLQGLVHFFERQPQAYSKASLDEPLTERVSLEDLPGHPTVTIAAPHPETDWRWGEESIRDVHWRDAGAEIVGQFLLGEEERGEPEAARDRASELLFELFDFKTQFVGAPPDAWTAKLVEAFLLEYVPAELLLTDDEIDAFPEILDRFFAWIAESGGDREIAREVRERVARSRPAFLREARNPARFGPDKVFSLRMQADGVDLSDDDAVQRYRETFEARVKDDPSLRPPAPRPLVDSSVSRKAWVWTPGEPVPDPKAPCPCGSGVPYRKCCRPR